MRSLNCLPPSAYCLLARPFVIGASLLLLLVAWQSWVIYQPAASPASRASAGTPPAPVAVAHPTPEASPAARPLALRWRFETNADLATPPVLSRRLLYVGSRDGYLFALDAATGEGRWGTRTGGQILAPVAVTGGDVVVADGGFATVSGTSGDMLTRIESDRRQLAAVTVAGDAAYAGGRLNTGGGVIERLEARSGMMHWREETRGAVPSAPLVAGDLVMAGTLTGEVIALDAATGERRWQAAAPGPVTVALVAASDLVIVGGGIDPVANSRPGASSAGSLIALDAVTGQQRWGISLARPPVAAPVRHGNTLYLIAGGTVIAVAAETGTELRRWPLGQEGGTILAPLVMAGDVLYAGDDRGMILALNVVTGVPRWYHPTTEAITGLAVASETLYLVTAHTITATALVND